MVNEGASVVINSRSTSDVDAVAEQLGSAAVGMACDVSDPRACERLVDQTVERFGRLDVLINNAGAGILKSVTEMSIEEWRQQIDVNLGGVFYL